ncbi:MAG: hypothetical protein J0H72_13680 [Burkholderiales bacterium]|nr:hypothetical protein [Burkholderiales bacterium]
MSQLSSFPDDFVPDIRLSKTLARNAMGHLASAERAANGAMDNAVLHGVAIAIELLLKANLLQVATTDTWNRVQIRHDLDKAAQYAERAGLALPQGLERVIAQLHPHFQRGGFRRDIARSWPSGFALEACAITRQLAHAVFDRAHQDAHSS